MNRKLIRAAALVLSVLMLMTVLCSCGKESKKEEPAAAEKLKDEQLLSAVKNYCLKANPDLEEIVNAGEYTVYWEITSNDGNEAVVLYRSYTAAENLFYINLTTGDTRVTENVPGITDGEQETDISFNIKDYLAEK